MWETWAQIFWKLDTLYANMIIPYKRNSMTSEAYRKAKKMKNVFDFDERSIQIRPCIVFNCFRYILV